MDILLFLLSGIIMCYFIDKRSKVGTVAYSVMFIFMLVINLFLTDSAFISGKLNAIMGDYYTAFRDALHYVYFTSGFNWSAFFVVQLFTFISILILSMFIAHEVIAVLKEINEGYEEPKKKKTNTFPKTKSVLKMDSKIFLLFHRFLN